MFGQWTEHLDELSQVYQNAKPFEHVVIKNFFTEEFCDTISLPDPNAAWYSYDNPFEGKYLLDKFSEDSSAKKIIDRLYSEEFLNFVEKMTGLKLEPDPYLNAGGLHAYTRNGRSGVHLDYTIHPITGKERRVSIMVYLSKNWDPNWGGKLSVWDPELKERTVIEHDLWNTAIIFRTNGLAYHGFPEPMTCPEGEWRKVIGIYYMSDPTPESLANPRHRAIYFPTPGTTPNEKLKKLYELRRTRRITPEDLEDWPTWRDDCGLKN